MRSPPRSSKPAATPSLELPCARSAGAIPILKSRADGGPVRSVSADAAAPNVMRSWTWCLMRNVGIFGIALSYVGCRNTPLVTEPRANEGAHAHSSDSTGGDSSLVSNGRSPQGSGGQTPALVVGTVTGLSASLGAASASLPAEGVSPKDYGKWFGEARRQHQRKNYSAAIEAYKKALSARPNAAEALAELGWAAYFAHDLTLAESSTRAALKAALEGDKPLRGAALYNLGVILEVTGGGAGAIEAFKESFIIRPSTAARQRLTKLDPKVAEDALTFRARPLAGPQVSLASLCPKEATSCSIPGNRNHSEPLLRGPSELKPQRPYKGVHVVSIQGGPYGEHSLAVRTSSGWYTKGLFLTNMAVSGAWTGDAEIDSMEYKDVIAGPPSEFVLTYTYSGATGGSIEPKYHSEHSERAIIICGLSPQEIPACTDPITLDYSLQEAGTDIAYGLRVSYVRPNWIELTQEEGRLPDSARAQLGRHRIAMP